MGIFAEKYIKKSNAMEKGIINGLYESLGKEEEYDASALDVWPYRKASDVVNGITLNLSNMAGGYPFMHGGRLWKNNEALYLAGEFSEGSGIHNKIQEELYSSPSGYAAKKFVKEKYLGEIREDFGEFRNDWMLYVVWQKCLGNGDFRKKLLSIPDGVVLVEDTTSGNGDITSLWGCANGELRAARKKREEEFGKCHTFKTKKAFEEAVSVEVNKIRNVGLFKGQNNMGKILMLCRECLKEGIEPPYDKGLLGSKKIFIGGKLSIF